MKKYLSVLLVLVLTLSLMTGCRRAKPEDTTVPTTTVRPTLPPTTAPTTRPTTAPTTAPTTQPDTTGPDMEDLIPGTEDTVDPSSGANQDATGPNTRRLPMG